MRQGVETERARNFGKTFVFANQFFTFFYLDFEIIPDNRLARFLFKSLANGGFAVVQGGRNRVERYV